MEQGVRTGLVRGIDYGVDAMNALQPGDPGIWQRILNVFRGQQSGPNAAAVKQILEANQEKLIQRIPEGPPNARNA